MSTCQDRPQLVRYHPRYCEENAWYLCADASVAGAEPHVVVISNTGRRVAMWMQRAAAIGQPIGWDYHVIVMARTEGWQVWDPDTRLGMPIAARHYLDDSFATVGVQPPRFDPRFRVVPAADYRAILRSDRSHMRRPDGSWQAPPPPWPTISPPDQGSNLERFLDMDSDIAGEVMRLDQLRARFA